MWTLAPTLRAVLQCSSPCGTFCRSLSVANQSGCSADKRNTWVAEDSMRAECDTRTWGTSGTDRLVCLHPAKHASGQQSSGLHTVSRGLVGVGILFQHLKSSGELQVLSLVQGGSAEASGKIVPGMTLTRVDGLAVTALTPEQVAPYILGPPGSSVSLEFKFQEDTASHTTGQPGLCTVTLTRFEGSAQI